MPQVCGELRQFTPNIKAGAIPLDELPRGETVTKILKPGPPADAPGSSCRSYSNCAGDPGECAACGGTL
jgi:hypothetical protein